MKILNNKQKIEIMFYTISQFDNFNRFVTRFLIKPNGKDLLKKRLNNNSFIIGDLDKDLKQKIVEEIISDSSVFLNILSEINEMKNFLFDLNLNNNYKITKMKNEFLSYYSYCDSEKTIPLLVFEILDIDSFDDIDSINSLKNIFVEKFLNYFVL